METLRADGQTTGQRSPEKKFVSERNKPQLRGKAGSSQLLPALVQGASALSQAPLHLSFAELSTENCAWGPHCRPAL